MKKIYFIRHAKSEKEAKNDFDRELNSRGKNDAKEAAKRLKKAKVKPDAIFSSQALRAAKTAKIFADELDIKKEKVSFEKCLYEASCEEIFEFIKGIDDKFKTIFIIGHNPAITDIAEFLSDSFITSLPTCAVFGIEFMAENFGEITEASGEAFMFDYPKMHS